MRSWPSSRSNPSSRELRPPRLRGCPVSRARAGRALDSSPTVALRTLERPASPSPRRLALAGLTAAWLAAPSCAAPPASPPAVVEADPVAEDVELAVEGPETALRARADRARIAERGQVLHLDGDVRARGIETGQGPRAVRPGRSLDIRAEHLVVDSRGRVATFEQHVELHVEGLALSCARLIVRYDARGQAETLRASGGVRVTYEQGSATAALAELDVPRRRVVLTGEPRLTRAGVSLGADRVTIDLASGRASLSHPRGTIALPAGDALP